MNLRNSLPVLFSTAVIACGEGQSVGFDPDDQEPDAYQSESTQDIDSDEPSCTPIPSIVRNTANAIIDRTYIIVTEGEIFSQDMTHDNEGAFILDDDMGGFYSPSANDIYGVPVVLEGAYHLANALSYPYDQYVANHVTLIHPGENSSAGEGVDILAVDENIDPVVTAHISTFPDGSCHLTDRMAGSEQIVCADECESFIRDLKGKITKGISADQSHYRDVCETPENPPDECFTPYI